GPRKEFSCHHEERQDLQEYSPKLTTHSGPRSPPPCADRRAPLSLSPASPRMPAPRIAWGRARRIWPRTCIRQRNTPRNKGGPAQANGETRSTMRRSDYWAGSVRSFAASTLRGIAGVLVAASLVNAAAPAQAADWPSRPVTVIVPYAAGGNTDTM